MMAFYGLCGIKSGSTYDMKQNPHASLRQVTEEHPYGTTHAIFKYAPAVTFTIEDLHFAFIYFDIPQCGRIAIPVRIMRRGYRTVSLLQHNKKIKNNSFLLAHFSLNRFSQK
jgi:hypothetical protein